jgi:RND family efflux transporter MFP subunit
VKTAALLLVLALAGCTGERPVRVANEVAPRRPVTLAEAQLVTRMRGDDVMGTVRARNVAGISSSVMGHVSALKVTLGSEVRAGALLAQLSADEIDAKLGQARATFTQAELELTRAHQLKASQTIPGAQDDVAEARFHVAKEALAEAQVMRGYTVLRAPFAGVVTAKLCEVGDLALPGKPLLVLESTGAPRFEALVPEASAQGLRQGQALAVHIDSLPGPVEGVLSELSPSADPVSRTVLVKLDLPARVGLRPGMFGRLALPGQSHQALLVPRDALVRRGQLELVFVVEDARARLRIVRSGRVSDDQVELLSGLQAGERVIVSTPSQLQDGQPVEVRP